MQKSHDDFNSIKVQLKLAKQMGASQGTIFQFHKGTIKARSYARECIDTLISIP